MKKTVLFISLLTLVYSCSKSDVDSNVNPLEKEYKSLTSENVNTFFLESAIATKGCGGTCNSRFEFKFKNLNYASEITRMSTFSSYTAVIWNYYEGDKQTVSVSGDYNEGVYALKYTLKDGRVLISGWIKF
jgi:hypothetical protein